MTSPNTADWRNQFLAAAGLTTTDLTDHTPPDETPTTTPDRIPIRYRSALATDPTVLTWMTTLTRQAVTDRRLAVNITTGPSLLLLGATGVGKTFQAYGVIRGFQALGVRAQWRFTSAADFCALLRPRHGVDPETVFEDHANARFLVLDDLGAMKPSEWVEEVTYRLVNRRYEQMLPTLFASNLPPSGAGGLGTVLGSRVASRLAEMATRVALKGQDRRYGPGVAA